MRVSARARSFLSVCACVCVYVCEARVRAACVCVCVCVCVSVCIPVCVRACTYVADVSVSMCLRLFVHCVSPEGRPGDF